MSRLEAAECAALDLATANGRPGYWDAVRELMATADEVTGEAGRNWQACSFTRDTLDSIARDIGETVRQARAFNRASR